MLNIIIFSKDRAAQLDLLIRSMERYFSDFSNYPVTVLYTASSDFFSQGYVEFQQRHPYIKLTREKNFKQDLCGVFDCSFSYTVFGVDDDVFLNTFSVQDKEMQLFAENIDISCLSLRLHDKVTYCYTENRPVRRPKISAYNTWLWRGQQGDWGYPMAIDFTVFRSEDLIESISNLSYSNPNTFEGSLANRCPVKGSLMLCYDEPRIVGIPINKVQTANGNRCGKISAESLNDRYLKGEQICLDGIVFNGKNAPHIEAIFSWEKMSC